MSTPRTASRKKSTARPARKTAARQPAARRRKAARPKNATDTVVQAGETVFETGRSFWLAGLGLAGSAVETASETFDALVARGRRQEPKSIAAAEQVVREVRQRANTLAGEAAKYSRKQLAGAFEALGVDNRPRQKNLFHRLGDFAEAIL
jgi:hypothetical protein